MEKNRKKIKKNLEQKKVINRKEAVSQMERL